MTQLQTGIASTAFVTEQQVADVARLMAQKRRFDYLRLPLQQAVDAAVIDGSVRVELANAYQWVGRVMEAFGGRIRAVTLGKPTLVLRDKTERTEGLGGGVVLVGTDVERIVAETSRLLLDAAHYERMASAVSPYGDGAAAEKIVAHLTRELTADIRRASTVKLRAA